MPFTGTPTMYSKKGRIGASTGTKPDKRVKPLTKAAKAHVKASVAVARPPPRLSPAPSPPVMDDTDDCDDDDHAMDVACVQIDASDAEDAGDDDTGNISDGTVAVVEEACGVVKPSGAGIGKGGVMRKKTSRRKPGTSARPPSKKVPGAALVAVDPESKTVAPFFTSNIINATCETASGKRQRTLLEFGSPSYIRGIDGALKSMDMSMQSVPLYLRSGRVVADLCMPSVTPYLAGKIGNIGVDVLENGTPVVCVSSPLDGTDPSGLLLHMHIGSVKRVGQSKIRIAERDLPPGALDTDRSYQYLFGSLCIPKTPGNTEYRCYPGSSSGPAHPIMVYVMSYMGQGVLLFRIVDPNGVIFTVKSTEMSDEALFLRLEQLRDTVNYVARRAKTNAQVVGNGGSSNPRVPGKRHVGFPKRSGFLLFSDNADAEWLRECIRTSVFASSTIRRIVPVDKASSGTRTERSYKKSARFVPMGSHVMGYLACEHMKVISGSVDWSNVEAFDEPWKSLYSEFQLNGESPLHYYSRFREIVDNPAFDWKARTEDMTTTLGQLNNICIRTMIQVVYTIATFGAYVTHTGRCPGVPVYKTYRPKDHDSTLPDDVLSLTGSITDKTFASLQKRGLITKSSTQADISFSWNIVKNFINDAPYVKCLLGEAPLRPKKSTSWHYITHNGNPMTKADCVRGADDVLVCYKHMSRLSSFAGVANVYTALCSIAAHTLPPVTSVTRSLDNFKRPSPSLVNNCQACVRECITLYGNIVKSVDRRNMEGSMYKPSA